jgi:hypothetical protein
VPFQGGFPGEGLAVGSWGDDDEDGEKRERGVVARQRSIVQTMVCMFYMPIASRIAAATDKETRMEIGAVNLPVGLLDVVLCCIGADAQRVIELCLLDHLGWFLVLFPRLSWMESKG